MLRVAQIQIRGREGVGADTVELPAVQEEVARCQLMEISNFAEANEGGGSKGSGDCYSLIIMIISTKSELLILLNYGEPLVCFSDVMT